MPVVKDVAYGYVMAPSVADFEGSVIAGRIRSNIQTLVGTICNKNSDKWWRSKLIWNFQDV